MARLLAEMMRGYLDVPDGFDPVGTGPLRAMRTVREPLPVSPSTTEWKVEAGPRRLVKAYKFSDLHRTADFLGELLAHEAETGHHARIICEFPLVTVELRTLDVGDITELDQDYASLCDDLYRDVLSYASPKAWDADDAW
jgi:pterin-4a-carbinolamine dehydratase